MISTIKRQSQLTSSISKRFCSNSATIKEASGKHVPYGTRGSSAYSLATKGCFDVMEKATPMALSCIQRLVECRNHRGLSNTPFVIADIGTADGGTSIPMMHSIISTIRGDRHHRDTPIQICYEDQPDNDWNSLLNNIHNRNANKIGIDPALYFMEEFDNIFVSLCGSSFYRQCFLTDSVDFIFSSTALHWLSSIPCNMSNVLHSAMLSDDESAEKRSYASQAALDWNTILLHRSRELKEYGELAVVNFCVDAEGQYLGNTFVDGQDTVNMHQLFRDLWRGLVDEEEFVNTNFVNMYRSLEEMASFDADIPLTLQQLESHCVPCPFYRNLRESKVGGEEYAVNYVPTLRTWSNSTFMNGLSDRRGQQEKEAIVDQLFAEYATEVERSPLKHRMDYVHGYAVFQRK